MDRPPYHRDPIPPEVVFEPPRPVWSAPPPRRPSAVRRAIHASLLPLTLLTLALAGGLVWAPASGAPDGQPTTLLAQFAQTFRAGMPYALWVLLILGSHEMGHYLACRYYRIPATLPFFIPGIPPIGSFGAVIRIRGLIPDRKALFDVAAAGPIAGFVVAMPVFVWGLIGADSLPPSAVEGENAIGLPLSVALFRHLLPDPPIQSNALIGAGWVGLLVTSLNLFPVGQLDGGHAVYAISRRAHRIVARTTLLALFSLILVQIYWFKQFPAYLLWFAILLWMRDRHPRLLDETTPLDPARKLVALLLLVMFLLSFIPVPLLMG